MELGLLYPQDSSASPFRWKFEPRFSAPLPGKTHVLHRFAYYVLIEILRIQGFWDLCGFPSAKKKKKKSLIWITIVEVCPFSTFLPGTPDLKISRSSQSALPCGTSMPWCFMPALAPPSWNWLLHASYHFDPNRTYNCPLLLQNTKDFRPYI